MHQMNKMCILLKYNYWVTTICWKFCESLTGGIRKNKIINKHYVNFYVICSHPMEMDI